MTLAELQLRFKKAVCKETDEVSPEWLRIRDGGPIPYERRLNIYQYAYFARIEESLLEDFPRLAKLLGEAEFRRLGWAYLAAYPSRYASLGEVSQHLPRFLREEPTWNERPWLADLAQLEWHAVLAMNAPQPKSRQVEENAADPLFELDPSVQLLSLDWAVDKRVRAGATPERRGINLVVYRSKGEVRHHRLVADQLALLRAISSGKRLSELLPILETVRAPQPRVAKWFNEWATRGIFVGIKL